VAEWTPERRAKQAAILKAARERKQAERAAETPTVASVKGASADVLANLNEQIADLQKQLDSERTKRSEAESKALAQAEAQGSLLQSGIQEVPTGKTKKVQRLVEYKNVGYKDDGREILKPVFELVEVPTFFYKIDMPPCGGTDLKINGVPYYHGATYEVTLDELQSIKDIVAKCWKHDADIHGTDENFYRKPTQNRVSARGMPG
jgi:hypothetical protein